MTGPPPTPRDRMDVTALNERDQALRRVDDLIKNSKENLRLADHYRRKTKTANARIGEMAATLAAIDQLHLPDPDTPTACGCGLTAPCPTRRELDR